MNILELIGNTPLIRADLSKIHAAIGTEQAGSLSPAAELFLKAEMFNPGGSIKDRAALFIVREAEASGALPAGGTIVEATSGNTGIGLALVGAALGYAVKIFMPDNMSAERRALMAVYGAELFLTPAAEGMSGAIARAEEYIAATPGAILADQFNNEANAHAHYETTGPEIWAQTAGAIDVLIATVGTGGTLSGTGQFLREKRPGVEIIAVEPSASPLLSRGVVGSHAIQGIGANFVPRILRRDLIDRVIAVGDGEAFAAARLLARVLGVFAGISSGAALAAALKLVQNGDYAGRRIVAILPDSGDRYLSTELTAE
ncbi:MAG: cysteine synthase A [Clostridiaceae bacterium]|nr:cysteine synthase A [Clostridiaceae bacterium]